MRTEAARGCSRFVKLLFLSLNAPPGALWPRISPGFSRDAWPEAGPLSRSRGVPCGRRNADGRSRNNFFGFF